MNGHLGAGVDPKLRKAAPRHPQNAQVLHQHPVRPQAVEHPQQGEHFLQLPVPDQRVDRHIDPHMMKMRKGQRVLQLFRVEIACAGPRAEGGISQIHRVRAGGLRPFQRLPASRRSQNLHPVSPPFSVKESPRRG